MQEKKKKGNKFMRGELTNMFLYCYSENQKTVEQEDDILAISNGI